MFDWFKKSEKKERQQHREHTSEAKPVFKPAQLPPRRSDLPTAQPAAIEFKHEEFVFSLGGDWVRVSSSDANQFCFESKGYKTSVVLSYMSLNITQDKILGAAERYALFRQEAEKAARHGEPIQFGDKWVELRDTKDVAEAAYAGYDSKMIFRFFGFVTQRKVLSLWVATETRDNDLSKRVFDEVFRGLKFYVP